MSNELVSIIVVTVGMEDCLYPLLDSVRQQVNPAQEVMVMDNSGNPGFWRQINLRYPEVKVHSNGRNLFYCDALNKGISLSKGDFILCLNDDVVLDKNFIKQALRGFLVNPKIGMVSGKILRSDAKTVDSTGLFLSLWRTAKERGYGQPDNGRYKKQGYIFGVNGAVAFYRKAMLDDTRVAQGYFDSRFNIFYEDLDIAWRAQRVGWKGYYLPEAVAYHTRGRTVREDDGLNRKYARRFISDQLHLHLIKNRYLTMVRNENFFSFLLHSPFIIAYEVFSWTYILLFRPRLIRKFSHSNLVG